MRSPTLRILMVGVGLSPVRCSSDKQFIRDLVAALPPEVTVRGWTLADIPPGEYPMAGGAVEARLTCENRLGHRATVPPTAYRAHPAHSRLRNQLELSASMTRACFFGIRSIINEFRPDLVHCCDYLGPSLSLLRAAFPHLPATLNKATMAEYSGLRARAYAAYIRSGLHGLQRIITHTRAAARRLEAHGFPRSSTEVIPWAPTIPDPPPTAMIERIRARFGARQSLLFLFSPRGGAERAAQRIAGIHRHGLPAGTASLVVAARPGDGIQLKRAVAEQGLEVGQEPGLFLEEGADDFSDLLWASDVLLAPEAPGSSTSLLPLTWLEAMARGKPVAGLDLPGAEELIRHGKNGLLVSEEQWRGAGLPQALSPLLDPSRVLELGLAARSSVMSQQSIEEIAHKYLEVWSDVLRS